MLDRCPHRAAALSQGRMTAAGNLQCAYHGMKTRSHNPHAAEAKPGATGCSCRIHSRWHSCVTCWALASFRARSVCTGRVDVRRRDWGLHQHPAGGQRGHHLGAYLRHSAALRRVPGHCVGLPHPRRPTLHRQHCWCAPPGRCTLL